MSTIAYALRADANFAGGTVNITDTGIALDVGEALEQGGGTIVVSELDSAIVAQLDTYGVLKRVAAPEGATPIRRYDYMNAGELHAEANRRAIHGQAGASAEKVRAALVEQDTAVASGDLAAANEVSATADPASKARKGSTPNPAAAGGDSSEA